MTMDMILYENCEEVPAISTKFRPCIIITSLLANAFLSFESCAVIA